MRSSSLFIATALLLVSAVPSQAGRIRRGPTSSHHKASKLVGTKAAAEHPRAIEDARAQQIQGALVKAGYLQEASGHWDATSQAAMEKLQGDNGWQTKLVPDSRALIKLGLGPGSDSAVATSAMPATVPTGEDAVTGAK